MNEPTFSFLSILRDSRTGYTYNPHAARRQGRLHEHVEVKVRAEVRGWLGGLPLFGLIVVAERVENPHTGLALFDEEDEIALTDAERLTLRFQCADRAGFVAEEERRDVQAQEYRGPGADECVDFLPDYDAAELVEIGLPERLRETWYADAA